MDWTRELDTARAAVALAGRYVLAEYARFVPIPNAPASISTHVDREAQEIILRHLRAAFPADGLVAEEATPTLADAPANAPRTWIVDPIDGTRGFAMKNGEFAVMVGLALGETAVLGVVLEPTRNRVTYAAVGSGCFVSVDGGEPTACRVSELGDLSASTLVMSHAKPGRANAVRTALGIPNAVETYSAGIKLAMVARGEVELYANDYVDFYDWDICAGQVLVEAAGGTVTEFGGGPIRYGTRGQVERRGMIASNGRIHAEVVEKLARR